MYGCGGNKANKLGLDGPAGWLLSGDYHDNNKNANDDEGLGLDGPAEWLLFVVDVELSTTHDDLEMQWGEVEPPRESRAGSGADKAENGEATSSVGRNYHSCHLHSQLQHHHDHDDHHPHCPFQHNQDPHVH